MNYEEYYEQHKGELIQAVKEEGYSLLDIMENKGDLSSKQFIVEYFGG